MPERTRLVVVSIETQDDGDSWILDEDYWYDIFDLKGNEVRKVRIPAGFELDFASIPAGFKWLMSNDNPDIRRAGCIHDYFYRTHEATKEEADLWFYYVLREGGVGEIRSRLMYWSVMWFGGSAYKARLKKKKKTVVDSDYG